jgi:SEL1 protein
MLRYFQGEKEGHNLLGIMYRDGLGVPMNIGSAKAYFQAAAQMELAEAKIHLGKFAGKQRLK